MAKFIFLRPTECSRSIFLRSINNDYEIAKNLEKIISNHFEDSQVLSLWQIGSFPFPKIRNCFVTFDLVGNFTGAGYNLILLGGDGYLGEVEELAREKRLRLNTKYVLLTMNSTNSGEFT